MANKKGNKQSQQFLSPENYMRQRVRQLSIDKCYVSKSIIDNGEGYVIVSRRHNEGKISYAVYLVDIWCCGVKDSFFRLRYEWEEFENKFIGIYNDLKLCSYEEAHNWIYGAVAFAEEGGIEPDKSFALTQYMLEEDTDDIPLIEYEFGKDGQHFLVCHTVQEANRYLPTLKAHLGNDVQFVIEDGKYDIPDLDEETMMERLANFEDNPIFKTYGPQTEYTYQHPKYPEALQLTTPDWFYEELNSPENSISLKEELVNRILELPHDLVRENLERIILYHLGQTCDGVPEDLEEEDYTGIIGNSVILLGEVGINVELKPESFSVTNADVVDPSQWDLYADMMASDDYLVTVYSRLFRASNFEAGQGTKNFIQDDQFQSLIDTCMTDAGNTQENLNALHDYVVAHAYSRGLFASYEAAIYSDDILQICNSYKYAIIPGGCIYADNEW